MGAHVDAGITASEARTGRNWHTERSRRKGRRCSRRNSSQSGRNSREGKRRIGQARWLGHGCGERREVLAEGEGEGGGWRW